MALGVIGSIIFLVILSYISRDSVEKGVFNAVRRYNK